MIVFLFSFLILPATELHSLPFEGYGILLVDLYDPQLSLPATDGENELDIIVTNSEQNHLNSREIIIDTSEESMESLEEIVDLLDIISTGYKSPLIGIEIQLYKLDNGYRQNLVTMNMMIDPSDEENGENYDEEENERSDSDERLEDFFVDVHHSYSPYDRLMNSYYGAHSANFLPMNLYRSYLAAQKQQNQHQKVYNADKIAADYWSMMFNQEKQEIPADYWNMIFKQETLETPTYQNYPSNHPFNTYNPNYPTLEDALRMYDMEMEAVATQELYGDDEEEMDDDDEEEENRGIFSSFGNFFRKTWRALID